MVIYKQNPMEFIDCKSLRSSIFTLKVKVILQSRLNDHMSLQSQKKTEF